MTGAAWSGHGVLHVHGLAGYTEMYSSMQGRRVHMAPGTPPPVVHHPSYMVQPAIHDMDLCTFQRKTGQIWPSVGRWWTVDIGGYR